MKLSFEGTQEIEFLFYVIICRKHRTFWKYVLLHNLPDKGKGEKGWDLNEIK